MSHKPSYFKFAFNFVGLSRERISSRTYSCKRCEKKIRLRDMDIKKFQYTWILIELITVLLPLFLLLLRMITSLSPKMIALFVAIVYVVFVFVSTLILYFGCQFEIRD